MSGELVSTILHLELKFGKADLTEIEFIKPAHVG